MENFPKKNRNGERVYRRGRKSSKNSKKNRNGERVYHRGRKSLKNSKNKFLAPGLDSKKISNEIQGMFRNFARGKICVREGRLKG